VFDRNLIMVFRNGKLDGPFSRPAVIAALKSGALTLDSPARTAASPQLRPLREIIDLTFRTSRRLAARNLLLEGGPWSSRGAGPEGGEMGVDPPRGAEMPDGVRLMPVWRWLLEEPAG